MTKMVTLEHFKMILKENKTKTFFIINSPLMLNFITAVYKNNLRIENKKFRHIVLAVIIDKTNYANAEDGVFELFDTFKRCYKNQVIDLSLASKLKPKNEINRSMQNMVFNLKYVVSSRDKSLDEILEELRKIDKNIIYITHRFQRLNCNQFVVFDIKKLFDHLDDLEYYMKMSHILQ